LPDAPPTEAGAPAIRDAATIILLREQAGRPQVLMGQRGRAAVFMPDLFVFPGGAVDPDDFAALPGLPLEEDTARRLAVDTAPEVARALPFAAIRELWEETGLMLGRPDPAVRALEAPGPWRRFLAAGLRPDTAALRLVFRAVTPPGRTRRFDARFFLAPAAAIGGDGEDFSAAGEELLNIQWLDLEAARALPLPFITEVVLSELEARLAAPAADPPVPFFHHTEQGSHFRLL
jgi:8-oxo-dGTP pyrophosphatase MutT (NUDIX family)